MNADPNPGEYRKVEPGVVELGYPDRIVTFERGGHITTRPRDGYSPVPAGFCGESRGAAENDRMEAM